MPSRPFPVWLTAVHALALSACTPVDLIQSPFVGAEGVPELEILPPHLTPRTGSMRGLNGDTFVPGFYVETRYGYWQGYGQLCGQPELLVESDVPFIDTEEVLWDPLEGVTTDILFTDCHLDPAHYSEDGVDLVDWLGPPESLEEAFLVARTDGHIIEARAGRPVLYAEDEEGAWFLGYYHQDSEFKGIVLKVHPDHTVETIHEAFRSDMPTPIVGRLCSGVRLAEGHPGHTFAAYAGLEAAAAIAFDRMADQLAHLGAPEDLIAACHTAADEERVHTALQTGLAAEQGLQPVPVEVDPFVPVDLFSFALDNRLEGCIRETFGAMVGRFQADHLPPGRLRDIWQQIATDEEGHAALSWRIAAWAEAQLTDAQREVLDARSEALLAGLVDGHDAPAGLPVVPEAALHVYAEALRSRVLAHRAA